MLRLHEPQLSIVLNVASGAGMFCRLQGDACPVYVLSSQIRAFFLKKEKPSYMNVSRRASLHTRLLLQCCSIDGMQNNIACVARVAGVDLKDRQGETRIDEAGMGEQD